MPPSTQLQTRETIELIKRKNWASHEPGVILVFCILFIVSSGLLALCVFQGIKKRRIARGQV
jgi:hypothetical protein